MSDRFNPIFVFEIRQVVRNRLILSALCLYLVLLVALLGYELPSAIQTSRFGNESFGVELTNLILRLLNDFSLGVLLIHTAMTTIDQGLHEESLFQTPIEANAMGLGKTYSAALITSLFYAVTLPFLTIAWMLRGVDLLALFLMLFCLFLLTLAINVYVAAAFFRCRDTNHLLAAIAGLIFALPPLIGIYCFSYMITYFSILDEGIGTLLTVLFWGTMIAVMMFIAVSEMFQMNGQLSPAYRRFSVNACFSWLGIFLGLCVGATIFFPTVGIIGMILQLRLLLTH